MPIDTCLNTPSRLKREPGCDRTPLLEPYVEPEGSDEREEQLSQSLDRKIPQCFSPGKHQGRFSLSWNLFVSSDERAQLLGSFTSIDSVGIFLNDTLLYIVSRHWVDLLSIQLFRLHPLPFCADPTSHLPCTEEAPSGKQACFAVGVLLAATVLRRAAIYFGRGSTLAWLGSSSMAGMLAGWAFGFACVQALVELGNTFTGLPYLNGLFTLLATAGSAVFILVCRPSTVVMGCSFAAQKVETLVQPKTPASRRRRASLWGRRTESMLESLEELWRAPRLTQTQQPRGA